jgi:hypothetical protein
MRKLIVSIHSTFNGVVTGPNLARCTRHRRILGSLSISTKLSEITVSK